MKQCTIRIIEENGNNAHAPISNTHNGEAAVIIQYSSSQGKNSCHKHFDVWVNRLRQNNLHSESNEKSSLVTREQSSGLCFWLDTHDKMFDLVSTGFLYDLALANRKVKSPSSFTALAESTT